MWSTRYFCQILTKLEFYRQILEKYSSIKFHEYPSSGIPVVQRGETDMTQVVFAFTVSLDEGFST
jgi:hypothetical protein